MHGICVPVCGPVNEYGKSKLEVEKVIQVWHVCPVCAVAITRPAATPPSPAVSPH